jgi:RNA polymerase sigma factor (sigma-70 family)
MTTGTANQTDRQLLADFATGGDAEAFAELVRRHGPMVFGVCRHMLRNEQDAEDALQATFLVLARKAGSIRNPEALPGWLYGVATRLATRIRVTVGRRRAREVPLVEVPAGRLDGELHSGEMRHVLFEEIGRLPERYRVPFVLCYLDGKSNKEAARQLNCAPGTIFSRLARARQRLRDRLEGRGLTVSSALLAATLSSLPDDASAAISTHLAWKTSRNAVSFTKSATRGRAVIPPPLLKLANHQIAVSLLSSLALIAAATLAGTLVCTTAGVLAWRAVAAKSVHVDEGVKGTWVLEKFIQNGQRDPRMEGPQSRVTLGDNRSFVADNGSGTYQIDTRTKPGQMSLTVDGGTTVGIFDLQGDTLTMCFAVDANGRPAAPLPPDLTPGPGRLVLVYSRQRP